MQLAFFAKGGTLQLKVLSGIWHSIWAGGLVTQVISTNITGSYLCNGSLLFKFQLLGEKTVNK